MPVSSRHGPFPVKDPIMASIYTHGVETRVARNYAGEVVGLHWVGLHWKWRISAAVIGSMLK
jgi:hypothetical protein